MIFLIKRRGKKAIIDFDAFEDCVHLTEQARDSIGALYVAYINEKGLKNPPNSLGRYYGYFQVLSADAEEMAGNLWRILDDSNNWVSIDGGPLVRREDAEETAGKLWHLLDDPNTSVNTDDGPLLRGGHGPKEAIY